MTPQAAAAEVAEAVPADVEPAEVVPPAPPTREEMRQRIRHALGCNGEEPTITVEEVIADMYASQYHFELTMETMAAAFSKMDVKELLGGFFGGGRKAKRRNKKEGDDAEIE